MAKNLIKSVEKIIDSSGISKITIFTSHLKIDGNVFRPEGKCEECNDDYITLENALVCRLNDYCTCEDDECKCNDYVCFKYDWLNIAIDKIVSFSIVGD